MMQNSCLDDECTSLAGVDTTLQALREVFGWPGHYHKIATALGVRWPTGVLLHGPPGCGKTAAVHTVARECGASLHLISAATIAGALTGEPERRLREAFAAACRDAEAGQPVIIFLDEVDSICPRRDSARPFEARIVGQLLTLLDGVVALAPSTSNSHSKNVFVVGATSRPNSIDPALRRPGRLEHEVRVAVPDASARTSILTSVTRQFPLDDSVDLVQLAKACHGYTGADLSALCREAAMAAMATSPHQSILLTGGQQATPYPPSRWAVGQMVRAMPGTQPTSPSDPNHFGEQGVLQTMGVKLMQPLASHHFVAAMKRVRPSLARGASTDHAPVRCRWDDIGGLDSVKLKIKQAVEWPLMHPGAFEQLGLSPARGILLYGPPGCSKSTLVRAAATASNAQVINLSGSQLYSMYVGDGEALLRDTFRTARDVAPCIVFLDELDSLVGKRVDAVPGNEVPARLLSALLTEMDGLELANGVIVMCATNRPNAIDTALLRPGRCDVVLYVPPPDELGRLQALKIHCRKLHLASDVDLPAIAAATHRFSGAELAALCREAAMGALREDFKAAQYVHHRHFLAALEVVHAQLASGALMQYEAWPN